LTVALDATYSLGEALSGVGVYSREILFGLAAAHPEAGFRFYYRPHRFFRARQGPFPGNARRRLLLEALGAPWATVFHGLNQRLPKAKQRFAVATFHDLFVLSGDYSTPDFRARFAAQAREAARRADHIIAVSEFTRQQVIGLLGVEADRVSVVHHGVRRLPAAEETGREKIILTVGAIQKRKNTARLIEAFESVDSSWKLVLAGSAGFGAREILARLESSPARARILTPGYVPEAELAAWYRRASVFAFPSLDEGFGMPVLEAMAQGLPVVTSRSSALGEVAGDAALLIDPGDSQALAGALQNLTRDEGLRQTLASRGVERARRFTWEEAVRKTWAVYRGAFSQDPA
jgi:glycosyltransferase involved in cell wall biosynthesis